MPLYVTDIAQWNAFIASERFFNITNALLHSAHTPHLAVFRSIDIVFQLDYNKTV